MLNHAHCVFIKGKVKKVFLSVLEKKVSVVDGKKADDLLHKMGRIGVAGKQQKVFLDALAHQFILFIVGEKLDQSLDRVGSLLVPNDVCDILMKPLHHFQSLSVVANAEKFLDHVIGILMGD